MSKAMLDHDVIIIGSGFGGSVSALRLREKGWNVAVIEQGRRLSTDDFKAAANKQKALAWLPALGLKKGFFAQEVFQHVAILRSIAFGGGSIVYGAVLLEPKDAFYQDPAWRDLNPNWRETLAPYYATAKRMLGRMENPYRGIQDHWLEQTAIKMNAHDSFGQVPQGIYFADPDAPAQDPFFEGKGPLRSGCIQCGNCYTGCAYNAKNSLDKNYLYFAEQAGVQMITETKVTHIEAMPDGSYRLHVQNTFTGQVLPSITAAKVILAAGALGTQELLFASRDRYATLPNVSHALGQHVRTNSEALVGILAKDSQVDLTHGAAISTHFYPDSKTHITQNRLPASYGSMRMYMVPMVDGVKPLTRAVMTILMMLLKPLHGVATYFARNWHKRTTYLTVMQQADNEMAFAYGRTALRGGRFGLKSKLAKGGRTPSYIAQANQAARAFAEASNGIPQNMIVESVGNMSVTAHILGGAVIAANAEQGVVSTQHEVFGHPNLFIMDGSVIPANVGVNPSLTITALAERFCDLFPEKPSTSVEAHSALSQ